MKVKDITLIISATTLRKVHINMGPNFNIINVNVNEPYFTDDILHFSRDIAHLGNITE
jgi:hypothetical protein